MKATNLSVGAKVRYQPKHYAPGDYENGIIKEIRPDIDDAVWVVYSCGGNWSRYKEYTGEKTLLDDLKLGWGPV